MSESTARSIPPISPGLFRQEAETITLIGGFSEGSGYAHFPIQDLCPFTGEGDVTLIDLPTEGSLCSWTEVTVAPPGYFGDVPYGFGIVELPIDQAGSANQLRVVTRLKLANTAPRIGLPMTLIADVVADSDNEPRTTWAFRPTEPAQ